MYKFFKFLLLFVALSSCAKEQSSSEITYPGEYTNLYVNTLSGFEDKLESVLDILGVSSERFVSSSTSPAWELSSERQIELKSIREALDSADGKTLLQKVIPLEDVSTYMNNIYGGTVGGFVAIAADVKSLQNMYDIYWGLRLDYDGTQFYEDGAGYAVIRFYSSATYMLEVPYCEELGGTQEHSWPNGGGGFTTSTLGSGGYPEFKFNGYYAPEEGAELYEVSSNGYQILRSVYSDGAWQSCDVGLEPATTTKSGTVVENGVSCNDQGLKTFVQTLCIYKGEQFNVRGVIDGIYHITTTTNYSQLQLTQKEKGVWGCEVEEGDIEKVWVDEITL